jgi:hypothetical protein
MDLLYILGIAVMWGVTAALVLGCDRLLESRP